MPSEDVDRAATAVQRLIVVCNDYKPVLRVKLNMVAQVLRVHRLRGHRPQSVTGTTLLVLYLVVLDVVTVGLLRGQQLTTDISRLRLLYSYHTLSTH